MDAGFGTVSVLSLCIGILLTILLNRTGRLLPLLFFSVGIASGLALWLYTDAELPVTHAQKQLAQHLSIRWLNTEIAEEFLLLVGFVIAARVIFLFSPRLGRALVRGIGKVFFWIADLR